MTYPQRLRDVAKALRSGEYKQGTHYLWNTERGHCCWGVACDLYGKENDIPWNSKPDVRLFEEIKVRCFFGNIAEPPVQVLLWLGIHGIGIDLMTLPEHLSMFGFAHRPDVPAVHAIESVLMYANDHGVPFPKIAEVFGILADALENPTLAPPYLILEK